MQFIGLNRAMSTKQLNTELLPEFCMFCEEHYVNPIMLPCLHSCCRECALYNSICKTCDEPYYQNGLLGSGFPQDLLLTSITAIQNAGRVYKEHNETIVCKNCCLVPISNATDYCVDCQVFICNFDVTAHLKFGSGMHNFIPLTQLNTSLLSDILPNQPYIGCPNHPLVHVDYICTTCDKLFCDDCSKMYHTDHPKVLVNSFIDEKINNLRTKVEEIKGKMSDNLYDRYMDERQKLEDQKFQVLEGVHRDFDFLVEKINERRNTLVYSIISQHDERIKLLQSVYERNEILNEKTKEALEIVEQYTATYPSKYILPLAMTLSHRLDDFTYHDYDMDLDIGKVEYSVNGLMELACEFDKIGHVDPIRRPKFETPIASYPKHIVKSGWSDVDQDQITLVATTVTMYSYLLVVFKTQKVCSTPVTEDNNEPIFKITIIDPYSPTRNLCHPKQIDVKSVTNLFAHKNRCTYLVDRVGKQLLKLDDMLNTVQVVSQSHILEDPVCISYDKTNAQFLVYNSLTNNVNRFDMSLTYLDSFDVPFPIANRLTRSNSDIHRLPPVSPRPRSKQSVTNAFFPEIIQPAFSEELKMSINLTVNSKETVFYVPNSKQMLYVLDKDGNLLREISLKDKINEEEISSPIQKQLSVEKPTTNQYGTLGRSRKRSNSNPKKMEQPPSPRERTPNFQTFICVNASDTVFIHQNSTIYIFNPDLELVVREHVPETFSPKSMNCDFFGHIFYTTEENILLC